ncbi:MAG: iron ABC transporter permease, partial [Lentisphaerae bacterium]|nr:iron ABC transporter permease [Lentisphaerota bacterium]
MSADGVTTATSRPKCIPLLAIATIALIALPSFLSLIAHAAGDPAALAETWHALTSQERLAGLVSRSARIAFMSALWATFLGAPTAWVLCRWSPIGRRTLAALAVLPALVPCYILAMGWHGILGPVGSLRANAPPWVPDLLTDMPLYTPAGVAFVLGCCTCPFALVAVSAALLTTDREAEEAACVFRHPVIALWAITGKPACIAVLGGALLVMLVCMGEYSVPSLYQVNVYPVEIHMRISAFGDVNGATVLSLPLMLPAAPAIGLLLGTAATFRRGKLSVTPMPSPAPWMRALGTAWCATVVTFALLLPLGTLAWQTAALHSLGEAIRTCAPQITYSTLTATATATATVLLGFLLVCALRNAPPRLCLGAQALALTALLLPGTLHGLGIIKLWNRAGPCGWFYGSPAILVIAYLGRYLAIALIPGLRAARNIPICLEEAARAHGLSTRRIVTGVYFPLLRRVLSLEWLLIFALTVAELNIAILLAPPGFSTLGVRLFTLLH